MSDDTKIALCFMALPALLVMVAIVDIVVGSVDYRACIEHHTPAECEAAR